MFITLEGIEGCGKTTQAKLLTDYLQERGFKVALTREPGWGRAGETIRSLLLNDREVSLQSFTELCLFCADRVEHVSGFIKPMLDKGNVVICDRYHDSTIVYQGYGRPNDKKLVYDMTIYSCLGTIPDITLLLDIPVQSGLARIKNRQNSTKFDMESIGFHQRVRNGFLEQANKEPDRIKIIDANADIEHIHCEIRKILEEIFTESDIK